MDKLKAAGAWIADAYGKAVDFVIAHPKTSTSIFIVVVVLLLLKSCV